jgi:hypothetical protein
MVIRNFHVIVSIILFLAGITSGQITTITYSDFINVQTEAMENVYKVPHRVESITMVRGENDKYDTTDSVVCEYESENRTHTVHDIHKDGKSSLTETIVVDSAVFERSDNGPWKRSEFRPSGMGTGSGSLDELTQATKTRTKLDGIDVTLYEAFVVEQKSGLLVFSWDRMLINDENLIVKMSHRTGSLHPQEEKFILDSKYTYNPSIKIKAPIP